jgi:hypothetical protein
MIAPEFNIRPATKTDVPFLADTIIEAEKSGTDILSYSTIFGLSEEEAKKYISDMLLEEIDGCELSISSFLVAENNRKIVAALSAWVEGINNISSSELKGNLLSFTFPKDCLKRARKINPIVHEIHIDYIPNSIQKGAGYVIEAYRHMNLFGILTSTMIEHLLKSNPVVSEVYTQIYGCNTAAIKANEKAGFNVILVKESLNKEILNYLPSSKKLLMKKELFTKKKKDYGQDRGC